MSPTSLFSVRTRLLAAVAKWAYQDDDRPHLARVLFDGQHMVGCDGHRLVVVPCETGASPFTVERADCAALAAAQRELTKSTHGDLTFLTVSEGKAAISLGDARAAVLIVQADDAKNYPPWEQLLKGTTAETATPPERVFEPRYLAAIDEVLQAVDGGCQRSVVVKAWTAELGPMLFEGAGIRFLIMPKRGGG